jgi:hypothetical protein
MSVEDFRSRLSKRPFEPFRVTLTDGRIYDVVHPELALVGYTSVVIGIPGEKYGDEPVASRLVTVSLDHVMQLEDVATASKS